MSSVLPIVVLVSTSRLWLVLVFAVPSLFLIGTIFSLSVVLSLPVVPSLIVVVVSAFVVAIVIIPAAILSFFVAIARVRLSVTTCPQIIEEVVLIILLLLLVFEVGPFKLNFDDVSNIVGLLVKLRVGCYSLMVGALLASPSLHFDERNSLALVISAFVETLDDVLILKNNADLIVEEVV